MESIMMRERLWYALVVLALVMAVSAPARAGHESQDFQDIALAGNSTTSMASSPMNLDIRYPTWEGYF
jgi:hypothetical protein